MDREIKGRLFFISGYIVEKGCRKERFFCIKAFDEKEEIAKQKADIKYIAYTKGCRSVRVTKMSSQDAIFSSKNGITSHEFSILPTEDRDNLKVYKI